ncbi:MAG: hypothetical protein IT304_08480 [Dehalococcoidia bacterium]|nr:hypothetical protein [Dehalococcoidia bacterium]
MDFPLRRASLLVSLCLATGVLAFGAACGDDDDSGPSEFGSTSSSSSNNSNSSSSSGNKSLDTWLTKVCDAAKDYNATTDKLSLELDKVDLEKDPKGGKTTLLDVYGRGRKAQDDAVKAVNKAGTPDIKGGADVKKALDTALKTNQQALDGVIAKIKAADPKSADFADKVDQAFTEAESDHFRSDLEKITAKQPAVQDVIDGFDADEECASVVFSGD